MADITIRLEMKAAVKLKAAMGKGVWDKLTKAEADALDDFITELLMSTDDLARGR